MPIFEYYWSWKIDCSCTNRYYKYSLLSSTLHCNFGTNTIYLLVKNVRWTNVAMKRKLQYSLHKCLYTPLIQIHCISPQIYKWHEEIFRLNSIHARYEMESCTQTLSLNFRLIVVIKNVVMGGNRLPAARSSSSGRHFYLYSNDLKAVYKRGKKRF